MKRPNIKLPDELHAYLKAKAAMKQVTMQDYLIEILLREQAREITKGKK